MAKKLETIKLISSMEKIARQTKVPFWGNLAEILEAPKRNKVAVNLDKLNEIAAKNKGKTLVVPGKILSKGEITEKTTIVSISISEEAKKKIQSKAEYITLKEFIAKGSKIKVNEAIIVA